MSILGIHHITAMCGNAQENLNFYTGVLGLRLVKATINYDSPDMWHLYYGDGTGRPGSLITFFPWPGSHGHGGAGQVTVTAYAVPTGSLPSWQKHLADKGVTASDIEERHGLKRIALADPDGLPIELVETTGKVEVYTGWEALPREMAIQGFAAPTLTVRDAGSTLRLLTQTMGFTVTESEDDRTLVTIGSGDPSQTLEIVSAPGRPFGGGGAGTVHHIAFRVADDKMQKEWQSELHQAGMQVTPVQDRTYFHSIYFREPSHILYEIATDGPGWLEDEGADVLGTTLALPGWLEGEREKIARGLPKIKTLAGVNLP